jgi:hypothetical protein
MKSNLGKLIISLILVFTSLNAQEYKWSASINKKNAYVGEAVHLHYRCKFNLIDELHVIEFNPVGKYKDFDIYLLSESEKIIDSKRVNDFEFVAFLKNSGKIEFNFDVLMKKTNQDSIDNTVLGRDNAEFAQFSKRLIKQEKLSIEVLPNDTKLVGDFKFKVKKDKPVVNAYEPYHFELIIEGVGNLNKLEAQDVNIQDAKVFTTEPKEDYILTKNGYKGVWSQKFAVVSNNDFEFSKIEYEYFSSKSGSVENYVVEPFKVQVKELYKRKGLIDKTDNKKEFFKAEYLYYFLIFLTGFVVGKIKFQKTKIKKVDEEFSDKVKKCKNIDELLVLLLIRNSSKYCDIIKKLELKKLSLKEAKNILL